MFSLETERLGLRPFTWDDLEFLATLNADAEVARYLGYGVPRTESESRVLLEGFFNAYAQDSLGHLLVYLKDSGVAVGRCGLTWIDVEANSPAGESPRWFWFRGSSPLAMETTHEIEIGYAFAKQHWGSGYATESAIAVRDYAFENRDLDCLVAAIFPDNHPSKNVARKIGMAQRGDINAFGMPAERHEILKSEWSRDRDT